TWESHKGPNGGKAAVTIDGVAKGTFDLYAPSAGLFSQSFGGLAAGAHTVAVRVTGTKNAASSDFWVGIDAFKVGATTTQDTALGIIYQGWVGQANASASAGTYRANTSAGLTFTYWFSGTGIDWVTHT